MYFIALDLDWKQTELCEIEDSIRIISVDAVYAVGRHALDVLDVIDCVNQHLVATLVCFINELPVDMIEVEVHRPCFQLLCLLPSVTHKSVEERTPSILRVAPGKFLVVER